MMVKVDVISGFLGAGKTTLIRKLLKDGLQNEQVVLIENEFGEIGIDGGFLQEAGIEIKEMNSGCICCSLVGDFGKSLLEVINTYHPARILIEPSGVGKLSDVLKAIENVANEAGIVINSASVVVDAKKCKVYMKNFGEFFENQVEYARAIILSRTQDVNEDKLHECEALLREHNTEAHIVTTPWDALSGEQILDAMEHTTDFVKELEQEMHEHHDHDHHEHDENCTCGCHDHDHHDHDHDHDEHHDHHDHDDHDHDHHEHHDHDHDHHDHDHAHDENCTCGCHDHDEHHDHDHHDHDHAHGHHHADEVFTSWGMETGAKFTEDQLKTIMQTLSEDASYGTILRAKGMVAGEGTEWLFFDMVPEEYEIRKGAAQFTGRICVIGSKINEDKLKALFGEAL